MTSVIFICCILGYFSGSIPFGLVLTRISGLGDIRKIGSGNIGPRMFCVQDVKI